MKANFFKVINAAALIAGLCFFTGCKGNDPDSYKLPQFKKSTQENFQILGKELVGVNVSQGLYKYRDHLILVGLDDMERKEHSRL